VDPPLKRERIFAREKAWFGWKRTRGTSTAVGARGRIGNRTWDAGRRRCQRGQNDGDGKRGRVRDGEEKRTTLENAGITGGY